MEIFKKISVKKCQMSVFRLRTKPKMSAGKASGNRSQNKVRNIRPVSFMPDNTPGFTVMEPNPKQAQKPSSFHCCYSMTAGH